MIHECKHTQEARRKRNLPPFTSHGSAIRHFKKIATETWWVRQPSGRVGFCAKTPAFPEGIYVTGNLR